MIEEAKEKMSYKSIRVYAEELPMKFNETFKLHGDSLKAVSTLTKINAGYMHHIEVEQEGKLLRCEMHPLVQAVNTAFYDHMPLVLTPDVIWYCLSSAVSTYVNKHAEDVRKVFVNHEGKKELLVERPDFILGKKNPWNEAVEEFCGLIKENTNVDVVGKLQADFSTTTKISRVVSQVVIMDAMKQYFAYTLKGGCGIPEIRLRGEKRDWESVRAKAAELVNMLPEFEQWIPSVLEVLDEFVNVFDDKVNMKFWKSIYHYDGGSGPGGINGWLLCFFPFLIDDNVNEFCWKGKTWKDAVVSKGVPESYFEYHMNQVPFVFKFGDSGIAMNMLFLAGLVGASVDKQDHALTPIFGYGIAEDKRTPSPFEIKKN